MPGGQGTHVDAAAEASDAPLPDVRACRSRPGKVVFIEDGNTDGWIATDAAVELLP